MILKPQTDPIAEALKLAGLTPTSSGKVNSVGEPPLSEVRDILTKHGASLDEAARALNLALKDEDQQLAAAKLTFQMHGALKDAEKPTVPSITINIQNNGQNRSLLNLLAPV